MYNKTIISFRFCDIRNKQGLSKCYQPQTSARLITLTSTLIIPDITKNLSNNVYNHNYNKILKSDWFSTALISALIGQFNRAVRVMPK